MQHDPTIDFDVVHMSETVLVRVYYRDRRNVLVPHAEIRLSAGADFPALYDSFRREYQWPSAERVETELLERYNGRAEDRSGLEEHDRLEAAALDLAEFFKRWLVLRGRGVVIAKSSAE